MVTLLLFFFLATSQEVGLRGPLDLKAFVESPTPWYPNQEGKFLYQIRYRGKIQLTAEDLPLLNPAEGFEKVGDKIIEERDELDYRVQEISQKVRPIEGGTFILPASHIEGYLYAIKEGKIIPYQKIKSELPLFKVDVTPFPQEGRPPFFNGSVGEFTFDLTPISIGDWITFQWKVKGNGVDSLVFPPLNCEPGLAGFFHLDDLPIKITGTGNERTFTFRLAPLIPGIEEVPPLSWSALDPTNGKYITWKSSPFPLPANPLPPLTKHTYPKDQLPPLRLLNPTANELLEKGEIPLSLLVLQREWRSRPWDRTISYEIHSLESRAGLPLSPFPLYDLITTFFRWLILPLVIFALWKRSLTLAALSLLITLFLLSPWGQEHRAIVLSPVFPKEGSFSPFLSGETVKILKSEGDFALIASKKQVGTVPLSSIIAIK
jgi:hypothetical protein